MPRKKRLNILWAYSNWYVSWDSCLIPAATVTVRGSDVDLKTDTKRAYLRDHRADLTAAISKGQDRFKVTVQADEYSDAECYRFRIVPAPKVKLARTLAASATLLAITLLLWFVWHSGLGATLRWALSSVLGVLALIVAPLAGSSAGKSTMQAPSRTCPDCGGRLSSASSLRQGVSTLEWVKEIECRSCTFRMSL